MKMIRSLAMLLCIGSAVHVYGNTLVITRGPASAGMGALVCGAISSFDNSYGGLLQSSIYRNVCYSLLNTLFPEEIAFLNQVMEFENIPCAIRNNYIGFKDMVTQEDQQQAYDVINYIRQVLAQPEHKSTFAMLYTASKYFIIGELAYQAACGNNVAWETGIMYSFDDEISTIKNQFDRVIEVLTYSPLDSMIQTLLDRNNEAVIFNNPSNIRYLREALQGFFICFTLADEGQEGMITLTKQDFDGLIDNAVEYLQKMPYEHHISYGTFTSHEYTFDDIMKFKDDMYERFNFDTVEQVSLVPSRNYDVILTSKDQCIQFAAELTNS